MTPLESFRHLWEYSVQKEARESYLDTVLTRMAKPTQDLILEFLNDPETTKEDILHLTIMLANMDKQEWDMVNHLFL